MKTLNGKPVARLSIPVIGAMSPEQGKDLTLYGIVHTLIDMGKFYFVKLRTPEGFVQCVLDKSEDAEPPKCESAVQVVGDKREDERAPFGFEILVKSLSVLSAPKAELPIIVNKRKYNVHLDTDLVYRHLGLRNATRRAVFKLSEAILYEFREFLKDNAFTEIHSPKIVSSGAEGGANIFKLDYFGKNAYLAQSPQFYKQMMIPVYERVCEIGPVFRAEKHDTARHLNEYISVDMEIGFIESFYDICNMEAAMIKFCFAALQEKHAALLALLDVTLPQVDEIPCVRFQEAKEMVAERYNRRIKDPFDLEPEEERLISEVIKETTGSEFVFVTHYPDKKRPFYAMNDPEDARYTLSFDLLFRGMEITTGGQRIHDYDQQVAKMQAKGLNPTDFESYLLLHKHGVPPHGGMGMGLERIVMKLLNEANIRTTALFPRDTSRLDP